MCYGYNSNNKLAYMKNDPNVFSDLPENSTNETKDGSLPIEALASFLSRNQLGVFPLHSISDGNCSCKQPGCHSPGKHPYYRRSWKQTSSSNKEKILKWFKDERFNFAVMTGRNNGTSDAGVVSDSSLKTGKFLVVIDVDAKEHPILHQLPSTFRYRTGSGGHHFWFWSDFPIANSVSKLADKVDIRGENGYVVIPPSRHVSGNRYELPVVKENVELTEIAPLPKFVLEVLDRKNQQQKKKTPRALQKKDGPLAAVPKSELSPETLQRWTLATIVEIRLFLTSGEKIPMGIRNNVIHRLLSSDRAKGASEADLWKKAQEYISKCDLVEKFPLSNFEIKATISQVLKYRAYNTSFENVNRLFFEFLERSKRGPMSRFEQERVLLADSQFFEMLCENLKTDKACSLEGESWVSLQTVSLLRDKFFEEREVKKHSRYPLPLLAKKLESLGFSRRRTNKGNLWNVSIAKENNGLNEGSKRAILNLKRSRQPFSPSTVSPAHSQTRATVSFQLVLPRNMHMTMKINGPSGYSSVKVNVNVRKHPSEGRYCGRVNRDSSDALVKLLSLLSPAEQADVYAGNFVMDEEQTAAEFDAMQPGDEVGVLLFFDEGWIPTVVKIDKVENDIAYGKDMFAEEDLQFTFEEVSTARAMGYFEILYRPDPTDATKMVPFGIETKREVTLLIPEDPSAASTAPSTSPTPPTTGAGPTGSIEAPAEAQEGSETASPSSSSSETSSGSEAPAEASSSEAKAISSDEQPSSSSGSVAEEPMTIEKLTAMMPGASYEQIRTAAEGLGIDITPKGTAVPARGRSASDVSSSSDEK